MVPTNRVSHFITWLSAVTAGNVVGGVVNVAVLNYGQAERTSDDP